MKVVLVLSGWYRAVGEKHRNAVDDRICAVALRTDKIVALPLHTHFAMRTGE